jgi:hypothetical protein
MPPRSRAEMASSDADASEQGLNGGEMQVLAFVPQQPHIEGWEAESIVGETPKLLADRRRISHQR